MDISLKNGHITINGNKFTGNNVSINNNTLVIDGVIQDFELGKEVNITVHGDVDTINSNSGTIKANNVGKIKTKSGNITCQAVSGSVKSMSGNIDCGSVAGNIKTLSGNITHR